QEWTITPRAAVQETWTSNVDLAPKGAEQEDFVTSLIPGLSIRHPSQGGLAVALDYDPAINIYAITGGVRLRNYMVGVARDVTANDHLFLDAGSVITQEF